MRRLACLSSSHLITEVKQTCPLPEVGLVSTPVHRGHKSPKPQYSAVPKQMCLSCWHVGALPDGCRRTEGQLSPTLAAKGYDFPTPEQEAAPIGWNQVNDDEGKKAWYAGKFYAWYQGFIQSGFPVCKGLISA